MADWKAYAGSMYYGKVVAENETEALRCAQEQESAVDRVELAGTAEQERLARLKHRDAERARIEELSKTFVPFGDHVHYKWRDPVPKDMAERIKVMRELWAWMTHVQRHYNPAVTEIFTSKCERSKGYLYGGSSGCIAYGNLGSAKEFELIAMTLNVLPELLDAWEKLNPQPQE